MIEQLFNEIIADTASNIWAFIWSNLMESITAIMVILTFFSLRSSNKQLKILSKQITLQEITSEKGQILDQIRLVIKPLRDELTFEANKIHSIPVNFRVSNKYGSLIFPIPNQKTFFIPNEDSENVTGQEMPLYHTILNLLKIHPELRIRLEERYDIYLQIAAKIANIEKELGSDTSKEQLECLVKTYCNPQEEYFEQYDELEEVIEIDTFEEEIDGGIRVPVSHNYYQVPVSQFIKIIIALLFDEIWDIEKKNVDLFNEEVIWLSS